MPSAEESPWQREALRMAPSLPAETWSGGRWPVPLCEEDLRAFLAPLDPATIERAVARAKGWRDLTPLEQAILDLPLHEGPTGDQIWHALPEALRPTVGEHEGFTMLELELVLRGIERRGMLLRAATGPQPSQELNAAIDGWATVPAATRVEVYERIIAGARANGGTVPVGELNLARLGLSLQGLAGAAGPEHLADGVHEDEDAGDWCTKCGTPGYYCGCPEVPPPSGRDESPAREPWGPAR